jgi:hypothetical protein
MWFAQAEAQFFLAGVSSKKTKFFHVISQLDHRYAAEVEDIITSSPERDQYTDKDRACTAAVPLERATYPSTTHARRDGRP